MTVVLRKWRFFTNVSPESSLVPLAAENTTPILTSAQIQASIIRLRLQLQNNVAGTLTGALRIQYSGDNTNWQDIGDGTTRTEDEYPIQWAVNNSLVTNNSEASFAWFNDTISAGVKLKNEGTTVFVEEFITEYDISLLINWPANNHTFYLRVVHNGITVAPATSFTNPTFTTPDVRPYTITKVDSGSTYPEPRDIRFGVWDRVWYDPIYSRWWTFFVNPLDRTRVENWYLDPADSIWKAGTNGHVKLGTNSIDQGRQTSSFKVINGATNVSTFCVLSGNNAKWCHGYLTDTGFFVGTLIDTVENRQRYGHTIFDSSSYAWIGSIDTTLGGIWVKRTTTACPGGFAVWNPTFETRKTLVDTGVADGNLFVMLDIDNEKVLCIWRNGNALKSATVTQAGGFSAITTVAATANPTDWGVTRNGDYIYLCHSSATGKTGTLNLKIYNISTDTWSNGPTGRTLSAATSGDGMCVVANGSDIFCFSTYASDNDPVGTLTGTTLREIRYQKYTPGTPVTSGTWSSTQVIPNSGSRVNMDYIGAPRSTNNGQIPILAESGDDELIGTPHILEYFMMVLNQNIAQSISVISTHTSTLRKSGGKLVNKAVGAVIKKIVSSSIIKKMSQPVIPSLRKQINKSKKIITTAGIKISKTYTTLKKLSVNTILHINKALPITRKIIQSTTALVHKGTIIQKVLLQPTIQLLRKALSVKQVIAANTSAITSFGEQVIRIVINQAVYFTQGRTIHKNITRGTPVFIISAKSIPKGIQTSVSISVRNIRNVLKQLANPIVVSVENMYTTGAILIGKALIVISKPAHYMLNRIITLDWGSTHDTDSTNNN